VSVGAAIGVEVGERGKGVVDNGRRVCAVMRTAVRGGWVRALRRGSRVRRRVMKEFGEES